jgi:hypothetical protein
MRPEMSGYRKELLRTSAFAIVLEGFRRYRFCHGRIEEIRPLILLDLEAGF